VNLSSGLKYYPIASSQQPSRDIVSFFKIRIPVLFSSTGSCRDFNKDACRLRGCQQLALPIFFFADFVIDSYRDLNKNTPLDIPVSRC
jgi:hypothetical protein